MAPKRNNPGPQQVKYSETARKFTKRCKNAIKKYTPDEIKENILGGWILENVHVFAKIVDLDMDIIDLNGRGIRATNKTFRYFKEAEEILESIGITVHLPDQKVVPDVLRKSRGPVVGGRFQSVDCMMPSSRDMSR